MAPSESSQFPFRAFLWISLSALILRIGTNLSRVDEYFAEGVYRGTLAKALLDGMPLWPRHIPEIAHVPGSIYIGVIAVPFYYLFGPTTFSMRMAGTVFHLAALAMFMILVHRRLGRKASILCGLLFAWAPPAFAKLSILSYGDHVESLPFIFFAAIYALEWAGAGAPVRYKTPFLAGLGVALAVGFHLQATLGIIALAAVCALAVLPRLLTVSFWKELFIAFIPGLAIGALPALLIYHFTYSSALTLWGSSPAAQLSSQGRGAGEIVNKLTSLWVDGFSYAFQWPSRHIADATLIVAFACAAALLIANVRQLLAKTGSLRSWITASGFFVMYPLVFAVTFAMSSEYFRIEKGTLTALEVRYFQPVIPLLLMPIGIAAARLLENNKKLLGFILIIPALGIGLAGSLHTWDLDIIKNEPARRGYIFEEFDGHLQFATLEPGVRDKFLQTDATIPNDDHGKDVRASTLMTISDPALYYQKIQQYDPSEDWTWPLRYTPPRMPLGFPPAASEGQLAAWVANCRPDLRIFAYAAAGRIVANTEPYNNATAQTVMLMRGTPQEIVILARSFGFGLLEVVEDGAPPARLRFFSGKKVADRIVSLPNTVSRGEVAFGLGFRLGMVANQFLEPSDWVLQRVLTDIPGDWLPAFACGLGAGYRMRFLEPPAADSKSPGAARIAALMPPRLRAEFYSGLAGARAPR
ncbi:MAG: hypothetical protein ACKVS6_15060 [Planctomycetota bacterium]